MTATELELREAIVLQAAEVLSLVPEDDKPEAARMLDDLIELCRAREVTL